MNKCALGGDEVSMTTWLPENEEVTMPITGAVLPSPFFLDCDSEIFNCNPGPTDTYYKTNFARDGQCHPKIFNKHNDVHDDGGA